MGSGEKSLNRGDANAGLVMGCSALGCREPVRGVGGVFFFLFPMFLVVVVQCNYCTLEEQKEKGRKKNEVLKVPPKTTSVVIKRPS